MRDSIGVIGQGYLGCALANYFNKQGYPVFINSRIRRAYDMSMYPESNIVAGDIEYIVKKSDHIIWASGLASINGSEDSPLMSYTQDLHHLFNDLNTWSSIRAISSTFTYLSSYSVFGDLYMKPTPTEYTKPEGGPSVYSINKLKAEEMLRRFSGIIRIIRLPNIIGYDVHTYSARMFFDYVAQSIPENKPVTLYTCDEKYSYRDYLSLYGFCQQIESSLFMDSIREEPVLHVSKDVTASNEFLARMIYAEYNNITRKDIEMRANIIEMREPHIHPIQLKIGSEFNLYTNEPANVFFHIDYKSILKQNGVI